MLKMVTVFAWENMDESLQFAFCPSCALTCTGWVKSTNCFSNIY